MEQIFAFMLLVGCNADGSNCAEIPIEPPFYDTLAECEADRPLQIRMTGTHDAQVLAACTTAEEALLEQDATIEWAVTRGGKLTVALVPDDAPDSPAMAQIESSEPIRVAAR